MAKSPPASSPRTLTWKGSFVADGSSTNAILQAFEKAGHPLPKYVVAGRGKLAACTWKAKQGTSEQFELATVSARNWIGRIAIRKAVAAANGITDPRHRS